jgi:hypothetical protein
VSTTTVSTDLTTRILQEGYGGEAWHGAEMKAALADLSPELAFWRPGNDRHNIAEIAIHHAYCVHSVRGRLSEKPVEAFPLEGEDWFALADDGPVSVKEIVAIVDAQQKKLASLAADIDAGRARSALAESERFTLILGITCHAVYHAGQIQLIKKLRG